MDVHARLARHLLVDGYRLVLDLERSRGSRLVDARTGRSYLDFYSFFASAPLGVNPFGDDEEFLARLGRVAANKPANPDLYTAHLADFAETFARVLGDPELPHLFFVEGGALAVENALKCAFDWKSRRNEAAGRSPELGTKVLHLTRAFHGRSGYTLSLTNTDPVKTDRFPKFDWPRIEVPAVHLGDVEAAEERALAQARAAFERHPHDIACFIAEPIQGEGGDNHMRAEFLQAMERLCHEHDALFVLDEVQTGGGTTGTPWAYQQLGLRPDVVAFAKKVQVGGVMAGRRVDLVPDNVFRVSGRINSTWGGGLVDMVRSRRMLEIIERDGLIPRARELGEELLAMLLRIQDRFPGRVENARGRGLMCAFDLPSGAERDRLVARLREDEGVLVLPCGERSVRLRPALSVTPEELREGTEAIARALEASREGSEAVVRALDPVL
ncbi:L-lysine 6-transaminase [Planomonospora corallina]|uniref:L-lysine-epsilon aminotransferase n=1 Tax=Planomonospora corallina TaxID=1806052 RepID=A0ABV8I8H7_9ACTN